MIGLYILLGIAFIIAIVVVMAVVKMERKRKPMKWESELLDTEEEQLDILFEDIWGELDDKQ